MKNLFVTTWKNYFKVLAKKLTYSKKAVEKGVDYLIDCEHEAINICEDKKIQFERLPISETDRFSGFHYFNFKKIYDGQPKDFEEAFIMEICLDYYKKDFNYDPEWEDTYNNLISHASRKTLGFREGLKIAQKKDKSNMAKFKQMFKNYLK